MSLPNNPILSLHQSGFSNVHLHSPINEYRFLKPVINTGYTKDFYFFPEEKYFYSYDVSALKTDLPGACRSIL